MSGGSVGVKRQRGSLAIRVRQHRRGKRREVRTNTALSITCVSRHWLVMPTW